MNGKRTEAGVAGKVPGRQRDYELRLLASGLIFVNRIVTGLVPCRAVLSRAHVNPLYYDPSNEVPSPFHHVPFPHPPTSSASSSFIRIASSSWADPLTKPYNPSIGVFGTPPFLAAFAFVSLVGRNSLVLFRWSDCQAGVHPLLGFLHLYCSTWHLLPNHQTPSSKLYRFNAANPNPGFLPTCRG